MLNTLLHNPIIFISEYFSNRSEEELALFTWKRPFELSSNPSLYVDGTSRRDVIQGILGDCWLLSTCAAIAKREDLMHRVLSPNQVQHIRFIFKIQTAENIF